MNYVLRSLQLDLEFLSIALPSHQKLSFILIKYFLLIKHGLFGFHRNAYTIGILGRDYFYDDKFGIAFLQSVYIDHSFLKTYLSSPKVIVDVGANIGQFNFFCHQYLNAKEVYSFEPTRHAYDILKKNAEKHTYHYAVTTKKKLSLYFVNLTLTASSVVASFAPGSKLKEEKVPCITLDQVKHLREKQSIDLLKIDTEGSELDVLRASRAMLKKSKYLFIEASLERESTGDVNQIISFLNKVTPDIKLIAVGRSYTDPTGKQLAVDLLFRNQSLEKHHF